MNKSPRVFNSELQFRFPYLGIGSHGSVCSQGFILLMVMACIHLSDSPILGPVVCTMSLPLLWIQEEVLIFQVCSSFYLLLGCSGHFQPYYMQNWKPEVLCSLFN